MWKDCNWNQFNFNFIWIYFQLIFLLNLKHIYWCERISIEINLLQFIWIYFQLIFLLKPQTHLLMWKDCNWNQFYFQFIWIYFQLIFLVNLKNIYWCERIAIEINLPSIHLNLLSIDFPFKPPKNILIRNDFNWNQFNFNFIWIYVHLIFLLIQINNPKSFCAQTGCHGNNCIIEDLSHSWGTPLKNCFGCCFFNKGLIRNLIIWENLAVSRL